SAVMTLRRLSGTRSARRSTRSSASTTTATPARAFLTNEGSQRVLFRGQTAQRLDLAFVRTGLHLRLSPFGLAAGVLGLLVVLGSELRLDVDQVFAFGGGHYVVPRWAWVISGKGEQSTDAARSEEVAHPFRFQWPRRRDYPDNSGLPNWRGTPARTETRLSLSHPPLDPIRGRS